MALGDNGLVKKAEQAKNMVEESSKKEQEELSNAAVWLNELIYGEGGNGGNNNIETNGMDTNSIDTNSIDTNTIEPPPVEIPDGNEEGAIMFGSPTWTDGKANVTIGTETEYKIEYQINNTEEGSWKKLSLEQVTKQGTVTDINHNDTIYARLTDGDNYGEYASITIKDSIAPTKANIEISKDSVVKGTKVEAKVTHTDNETGVDIGKCKWILTNSPDELGTDEESYTGGTFSSNGETIIIPTTEVGEYYLHVLTADKAGNKIETVSNKITVKEITGNIDIKGPTWKGDGTAEIEISTDNPDVTIKYQVNDGEWKEYEGPITGLENGDEVNIKLTNGDEEGEEKTIQIRDTNAPQVDVSLEDKSTSEIEVRVEATDDESGMASPTQYIYYIKKSNDPDMAYVEKARNSTNSYTFTELEQGTSYDIKVEVQGDKAGNKGTGLLSGQTTETIPGGEDSTTSGAISFGSPNWIEGAASIVISTNTSYKLQYQINGTEESWKDINSGEEVTGLKHNNTVYARLTDGSNYGEPASKVITDEVTPAKATISLNKTEAIAGQTISATVTHEDNESGVDIAKSKWVFNTSSTNIGTSEGSYTGGTFSSNGQTISIPTSSIGTYYLHVLTVDKAGNKTETISEAVVLKKIEGDIEIGAPTWEDGTASVALRTTMDGYTIQYKINSGSWLNLADAGNGSTGTNGTVSGLNHNDVLYARLTNGSQYGNETQTIIKDSTVPKVIITANNITTNSIGVRVEATDNESGMANTVTYVYYIKKSNEADSSYVQKASNNTNTYTFNGLTQGTSYDIKVEVQGDKAGNKGTGTLLKQTTSTIPGGETGVEEGAIAFGAPMWEDGAASVQISTNTSYSIEYQKNSTSGSWQTIANKGTVSELKHNDTIYARLTDGVNKGEYASITIKDTIAPQKANINLGTTSAIAGQTITATVTHADNESGVDITKSKWVFNTTEGNIGTEEESYTGGTFTANSQTISIPTSSIGTYYLHVLTVDKAGNKLETISSAVTIKKIEGNITFGEQTWSSGTASVVLSTTASGYSIQYKVNSGEWKNLSEAGNGSTGQSGTVSGLRYNDKITARLTNGAQYGDEATYTVTDTVVPVVTVNKTSITTNSIAVSVKASDNESGMTSPVTYTYYIKKSSEEENNYVQKISNSTSTYIFSGLTQGTSYDIKVEAEGDKAGNKGIGTLLKQTTETIPGGDTAVSQGAITFGTPTWSSEVASIKISTNTSYNMQYQINETTGEWKALSLSGEIGSKSGTVSGLKHNDTVYVRLTDGTNVGATANKKIIDEEAPQRASINLNKTEAIVGQTISATVTHEDNESGVDIAKSKWVFNTSSTNIGTSEGSYTGTFSSNGQTINIPTSGIGTYYLHVLTIDKAGNKTETISKAVVLKKIEGSIEIGAPTWKAGTASVTLSTAVGGYTIQYKVNSGSWLNLADAGNGSTGTNGTVSGLNHNDVLHVRLTNGAQYGDETQTTIKDSTAPKVVITAKSKTTNSIGVSVNVTDNESGMANTVTYMYYIKKSNEAESSYVEKDSNNTNTYTFSGLMQGTSYDIKVEAEGDKAGNKGTGTLLKQTTSTIPGGETGVEEGAISFGNVTWSSGAASVQISTNTSYSIEYQKDSTSGSWQTIENKGTVSGLKHNDTIYARLTDGVNKGEHASITIKDTIEPQKASINLSTTTAIAGQTITATVTHADNESGVDITKSKWVFNTSSTNIGTSEGSYTGGTFSSNGQTISIPTSSIGTYYLHVLTVDKAGNKLETISSAVTLKKIEGTIKVGSPTWASGKASVSLSTESEYSIQYKINSGNWTDYTGTIENLNHNDTIYMRLTNGEQYGGEATYTIKDSIAPSVQITQGEITHESIEITVIAIDNETGLATENTYKFYLNDKEKTTQTEATYIFTELTAETPYNIKVEVYDKAGNMNSQQTSISTIKEPGINAEEISKSPKEYYGTEVKGYTCKSGEVSTWRIYYADKTNIYLIADDYISPEEIPNGQNGSKIIHNSTTIYKNGVSMENVINDYTGANWINSNSKGSKWLSQYLSAYGTQTSKNIKAVAYMMDTNIWSVYAGENAEYAMGGPTIELFCASYKDTHPSKYIECDKIDSYGYYVKWNSDSSYSSFISKLTKDDFNSIYIKSDDSKATGIWLASPSTYLQSHLMSATYGGGIRYVQYDSDETGFRPIVCLKSDVRLEKLGDGNLMIKSQPKSAEQISKASGSYYGKEVEGYTCESNGVNKWRIFYADESNIYLIADDYIMGDNAPNGKNGTAPTKKTDYKIGFDTVVNDYSGASWINSNSKGAKWLNQFLSSYGTEKSKNIKAVAYMMDTNIWSAYAGENAEYAMGGPTIELFCASYKDTHLNKYIECGNTISYGYNVKWNTDLSYSSSIRDIEQDKFNSIYIKSDSSKAGGMYLASPSASGNERIMDAGNIGLLGGSYYAGKNPRTSSYRLSKNKCTNSITTR